MVDKEAGSVQERGIGSLGRVQAFNLHTLEIICTALQRENRPNARAAVGEEEEEVWDRRTRYRARTVQCARKPSAYSESTYQRTLETIAPVRSKTCSKYGSQPAPSQLPAGRLFGL